jgi:ribonucleoside-diphosphate reductase alpha chain
MNGENQPFEVFINTAKAGSDTAAVSEAIGRLISYILRLASPIQPRERLKEVWRQLSGIGGGRSLGFGPNRVRSLPDGVARTIAEYLEQSDSLSVAAENDEGESETKGNGDHLRSETALAVTHEEEIGDQYRIGDLCPDCGQAALVSEEGCCKCYSCGYSEC